LTQGWVAQVTPGMSETTAIATRGSGGAPIKTELSVARSKDTASVGIVSFAAMNPAAVVAAFTMTKPQTINDAQGAHTALSPTRELLIAGDGAVAEDFEVRAASGDLVSRGTYYAVNAGDRVVFIRAWVGSVNGALLPTIERALVAIKNLS
jgi:hypothetical protein